ncbi:hypothetical protein AAF712_003410 [Marasmius tenuissimus]|uniref:Protein kinase domain-containing protein n=1 Tax=Marasmius tenuissimus TaxID=585030 RepID=A0ABR3AA25_9AGAR
MYLIAAVVSGGNYERLGVVTEGTENYETGSDNSYSSVEFEEARDRLRTIFLTHRGFDTLLELNKSEVPLTVDSLQMEIRAALSDPGQAEYRRKCIKSLMALVNKHHILPKSLFVRDVMREGTNPVATGGYADIYKGLCSKKTRIPVDLMSPQMVSDGLLLRVCLKVLRFHIPADQHRENEVAEEFYKEALVWTQLSHPNILPFHGVSTTLFPQRFCLISPWMENGDIITFLKRAPAHDKLTALLEISAGIAYLHELKIVHGDIKGANILVDKHGKSRLGDFGLARIVNETLSMGDSTTENQKGTVRWMAPELFHTGDSDMNSNPSDRGNGVKTKNDKFARDLYAFACTVLEIMTGKPPFAELRDPMGCMFQVVVLKKRPPRPSSEYWCPDNVWDMVEQCWAQQMQDRPKASEVHKFLSDTVGLRDAGHPWENRFLREPPLTQEMAASEAAEQSHAAKESGEKEQSAPQVHTELTIAGDLTATEAVTDQNNKASAELPSSPILSPPPQPRQRVPDIPPTSETVLGEGGGTGDVDDEDLGNGHTPAAGSDDSMPPSLNANGKRPRDLDSGTGENGEEEEEEEPGQGRQVRMRMLTDPGCE